MLKIENLSVFYGGTPAIRDISISMDKESIVSLIGTNGAGKTTVLKAISGILKIKSGKIEFNGQGINQLPPWEIVKRGIVHVPEGRQIFPDMSVLENLEMGGYIHTDRSVLAGNLNEVFDLFPILRERNEQLGGSLSGGEQQMLAVGRGLMASPRLLLLDEPSHGLAPLIIQDLIKIIERIRNTGIAILLVEQNMDMAYELSEYAYLLEAGRVALSGQKESLFQEEMVKKVYLGI